MSGADADDPVLIAREAIDRAVREHDEAVARVGLEIWVGAEPTFTDRYSTDPAWLVGALGADKEARARELLADLRDGLLKASLHPRFAPLGESDPSGRPARGIVLRSVGRRYPGEERPRWSYGLFCLRDGAPLWDGPRDPLELERDAPPPVDASKKAESIAARDPDPVEPVEQVDPVEQAGPIEQVDPVEQPGPAEQVEPGEQVDPIQPVEPADELARTAAATLTAEQAAARLVPARQLRDALATVLTESERGVAVFECAAALPLRLAYRLDDQPPPGDPAAEPRLTRGSFHTPAKDEVAPVDALSAEGSFVVAFGVDADEADVVRVELPGLPDVPTFVALLQDLAEAARRAGQTVLVLGGHPPPVNPSAAWTTVTPDPGVVEVNMAPAPNVSTFLEWLRALYAAAERGGLSPWRLWFNGDLADSGGGGHVTLGGPTPERSPFFLRPRLLPALIAYLNHHPSLSYLFGVDSLGSSSQSPRPDEGVRESFEELSLALGLLGRMPSPTPDQLWGTLAPFLADRFGNVHRAEVNVEKLWNPFMPGRGRWGVVELRALRMQSTPERAAALAALFRALAAMLAGYAEIPGLVDWGATLHDRFALPFFLERDLEAVFADLEAAGLGLPEPLAALLRDDQHRVVGEADLGTAHLTVRRAIEFWPLVGDPSTQESRTARLIDSSTMRLEILLRPDGDADLAPWRLAVGEVVVPLSLEHDAQGPALVKGLRLRAFVPTPGLHPSLGKQLPLCLTFFEEGASEATRITLHDWTPSGVMYDGLPADGVEAARRRAERFVVERVPLDSAELRPAPHDALSPHALDLRRI